MCYRPAVTWEQIIGLSLALLLMLVALIGNFIPGVPGTPLALIAAVGHRLYFGADSINNLVLGIMVLLTVMALVFDFLGSALGAKKFGATWRGVVGAVVGGLIGLFFSLPGIILGPFIGATLFEMLGDKQFKLAAKAGAGAVVGLALGVIGKSAICVVMIILFATNVVVRSGDSKGATATLRTYAVLLRKSPTLVSPLAGKPSYSDADKKTRSIPR